MTAWCRHSDGRTLQPHIVSSTSWFLVGPRNFLNSKTTHVEIKWTHLSSERQVRRDNPWASISKMDPASGMAWRHAIKRCKRTFSSRNTRTRLIVFVSPAQRCMPGKGWKKDRLEDPIHTRAWWRMHIYHNPKMYRRVLLFTRKEWSTPQQKQPHPPLTVR